ncbi:TasA family protein [Patulibacter sp. SYSU D01012]|uniref:TasA family protein n=1 Tax=Patulibacter sp. SYSU D01012 TaxID=2817381 RepID=UPI001B3070FA|nr:TasA family protein [Patulibacter sp. SYSU D01012]
MLTALLRHPRRLIATLTMVLAAAGVAVGSGATFTSKTANAANTFTSGTLLQSNSKDGAAVVTGANLKPGDTKTGEVTIKNTGTLAGDFKLAETNAQNGFSAGSLALKIEDVTVASAPKTVYTGDLGGLGSKTLGSFAAGEAHTYRVTVTLATSAPNADQGKSATSDLEWTATPTA